ncbi:MAG: histidine--tRNA ligase [Chloroflexota bacterium]|nr:histidine--tRNA ligase [Chloroflexota bacterium]MDE2968951.1 histidine--tRNA ligase [Chloroflexota bacterium]
MQFRLPRGTQDRLPDDQPWWEYVTAVAQEQARRFGYGRIDTPVFEHAGLFQRGVGEGTDIVEKETYTFPDRSGEEITLRPEGTAPVCRAYLEHGMHNLPQPVRMHYFCPIFRYERPQAGRLRQHHQFGVEAIGDGDPSVDAEVIDLGWRFTQALGLKGLSLAVNSIGDPACRPDYLAALKDHYTPRLGEACPDCRMRYDRNPLRMLDCKRTDFACQDLVASAPRMTDLLCADCDDHFTKLRRYLDALGIPYFINPTLVRGLDYYTRTVFEILPPEEGAQSVVLGGGRYDGLIEQLGGRPTPGIGFGSGLERLILNVKRQEAAAPVESSAVDAVIVSLGDAAPAIAVRLASDLRQAGLSVVLAQPGRSLRGQMRHASALNARYTLVLGDAEVAAGAVQVKTMDSGEQRETPLDEVATALNRR